MTIKEADQNTWTPEPEPEVAPETEAYDEPDVEAETADEREFDSDGQPQPDLERHEESDTDLVPDTTATADEPETLDPPDEVDLPDTPAAATEGHPSLDDTGVYEERWITIKASFVDEPRQAVQSADRLVTEVMEDRAKVLMSHHDSLQAQWCEDDDVDTERLRVVFQDYRAFLFGPLST